MWVSDILMLLSHHVPLIYWSIHTLLKWDLEQRNGMFEQDLLEQPPSKEKCDAAAASPMKAAREREPCLQ